MAYLPWWKIVTICPYSNSPLSTSAPNEPLTPLGHLLLPAGPLAGHAQWWAPVPAGSKSFFILTSLGQALLRFKVIVFSPVLCVPFSSALHISLPSLPHNTDQRACSFPLASDPWPVTLPLFLWVSDRLSGLVFYGSLIKVCFYAWPLQNNHHNYNHNHNNGLPSWEPFLCCRHYAACFTWIILFLFHNSVTEVQILFLLYRKGKDLKEFASSPNSMRSLHSGTVFFSCFSSSKIYAHSLFHFPIPLLFCIKYNIFYLVIYGGPICFLHVLCVK